MPRSCILAIILFLGLSAAGCTPGQSPQTSAPTQSPPTTATAEPAPPSSMPEPKDEPATTADVDGDGEADLVAVDRGFTRDDPEGPPDREGSVQVVLSSGDTQRLTMSDLGLEWSDSTRFGHGRLVVDLNLDGYADVLVSDPTPEPEGSTQGAIYALWGGPDGVSAGRVDILATGEEASYTGWSMALVEQPTRVLALGTLHATGGGVALYPVEDGGGLGEPTLVDLGSQGIPGSATKQNEFGSALAASGSVLAIGDPGATVNGASRAGAVTLLRMNEDGFSPSQITEDSDGVPGAPEAGDEFGWSVSLRGGLLAVGTPGEGLDEIEQAGRVYLFTLDDQSFKTLPYLTQNSKGVPGNGEAGDRFGESVTVFHPCNGATGVLVGVPGELSGEDPKGAGAVQVIGVSGTACKALTVLSETTAGLPSPPLGIDGSLTVLRPRADGDQAEPIAAALSGGGVVILNPPFDGGIDTADLQGNLSAPLG